jgi:uncharacterized circularly permuted ATP-grasp superfamily protein
MSSGTNVRGAAPWRFLAAYQPAWGGFDEVRSDTGEVRPHYAPLVETLDAIGPHELSARRDSARRAIRDNGVTYNVHGDPQGANRPWDLDMIPLVLSPAEWAGLERGLLQRTRLLNLLLIDLHGSRRMLRERILPASLVLGSPAFLRACHGLRVPHDTYLHLHAVDLARDAAGEWAAIADRTQAPAGAGYALENRLVLLHSLPEVFRDRHVHRLSAFFRSMQGAVESLASDRGRPPKIVMLSPGPAAETYFEHAYLARQLGFTLVEGADLTVRDRRVSIKTLEGLQPVDVVVRRLDDGSAIRSSSVIRSSASPVSSTPCAPGRSRSPTPWAPA